MTIKVYGVPLSVGSLQWSNIFSDALAAGGDMAVISGLIVTSAGTRTVAVASGASYQVGTRLENSATFTVPQLATATTNPRVDTICAQVQWPATDDEDATDTAGSIVAVPGTANANPSPPALTKQKGVKWQTPLAFVRVNTNGSIVITDARPDAAGSQHAMGDVTLTTTSGGLVTIAHNLGVVPTWFHATVLNSNWLATPVWSTKTTTTIQVAVRALNTGALVASSSAEFLWKAEA